MPRTARVGLILLLSAAFCPAAHAATVGSTELTGGWALRSATSVADGGAAISQPGYGQAGWYPVTLPSTDAAIRHEPEPGSQNPEPADDVPVIVTSTDDCPDATFVGLAEAGAAGGGAAILPTFTPQLSVLSVYSWIVQKVCASHGSTLVIE